MRNHTKKALVLSVLSLMLCVSMLVGTTFAWFTDSVTTGVNQIVSGTLDIELEYLNPATDKFEKVDSNTKLFNDNALWEPGYTEVVYLKVTNAGNLALKYQLNVNVYDETPGKNVAGEEFKLSDHLVFKVLDIAEADVGNYTRETAMAAAGTEKGLKTYNGDVKIMENQNGVADVDYVALVLYMPTNVGNEANYREVQPSIKLGVNLMATQYTHESDSFNDQYDKDAEFATSVKDEAGLKLALKQGGNIILANDIEVAESLVIEEGTTVVLDLNGNTVNGGYQTGRTAKHVYAIENRGTLTLKNGTVNARGIANYGTLIVEDGDYNAVDNNGGAAIWNYAGSNVEVNGGTFTAAQASAIPAATVMHVADGATAVVNGGTFKSDADWTYAIISYGDLTINDANVVGEHGAIAASAGELTVNGGTYEITASGHVIYSEAATITLNGGSFKHSQIGASAEGNVILYASGSAVATVNGGSYDSVEGAFAYSSMNGNITVTGGTFANKATTVYGSTNGVVDLVADGHTAYDNGDGSCTVMKTRSGKVSYRPYILNGSRKAIQIDLEKIYAEESLVIELWHKDTLLTTTTYAGSYPYEKAGYTTCCVAMPGSVFWSWDTVIADGVTLTADNVPDTIKVYADGILTDTFTHTSGTVFADKVNDYLAIIG